MLPVSQKVCITLVALPRLQKQHFTQSLSFATSAICYYSPTSRLTRPVGRQFIDDMMSKIVDYEYAVLFHLYVSNFQSHGGSRTVSYLNMFQISKGDQYYFTRVDRVDPVTARQGKIQMAHYPVLYADTRSEVYLL